MLFLCVDVNYINLLYLMMDTYLMMDIKMNTFTNWKVFLLNVCIKIMWFGFQKVTILKQQQNNGFKIVKF